MYIDNIFFRWVQYLKQPFLNYIKKMYQQVVSSNESVIFNSYTDTLFSFISEHSLNFLFSIMLFVKFLSNLSCENVFFSVQPGKLILTSIKLIQYVLIIQNNILFFTKTHPIHLYALCTDMERQNLRVFFNAWVYPNNCLTNHNWSFIPVFVCQYARCTLVFLIILYILHVYVQFLS